VAGFDAHAALGGVRCPAVVVAGIDDRTVGLDAKHALANAIAGARLILVPDSGHVTNVDQPAAFNTVLKEFLSAR
jgi:pimeloyl-ACP methyl ester carboxylesterase